MKHLVIYRGLPGSSKTTHARMLLEALNGNGALCGRDHVRDLMFGKRSPLTQAQELEVSDVQRSMIVTALTNDRVALVDDMNLKNRYVRYLIELAELHGAKYEVIDFTDVPLSDLILRNRAREKHSVPEELIEDLYDRFVRGKGHPLPVTLPESNSKTFEPYIPDDSLPFAIMVDIDGTLAHKGDRDIYDGSKAHLDTVDLAVRACVWSMMGDVVDEQHSSDDWTFNGIEPVFCSGRSDEHRYVTLTWIAENLGLPPEYVDKRLFMRKAGDQRKDSIVKLELFDEHIRNNYNVLFALDDRNQVVEAWRSIGIKTFQVAEGDF